MGLLKFLIVVLGLGACAAWLTVPDKDQAEAALQTEVQNALNAQEFGKGAGLDAALVACRIRPDSCYSLLRSGLDLSYERSALYATTTVSGFGKTASCYGAFTKFFCPGGLKDAE